MQYANDLIAQATILISLDRRRPKQANLRRAVSSAYYALFHAIVDQAVALLVPASPTELKHQARRIPGHSGMYKVGKAIRDRKLTMKGKVVRDSFSADWQLVADTFIDLQEARHEADYDLATAFDRQRAAALVEAARQALGVMQALPSSEDRNAFLSSILLSNN